MALTGATVWEVQTGGSDTNNGGAFDPSQTSGMFSDGAATSATTAAPVFTSASYNFVAGDVGAWIYIFAGSNWIPGWYKIASVASNAATLNGTAGQGVLKGTAATFPYPIGPTTATGCATTASPTGATWSIDYSQQATAQFTYTDLASAGAGLTVSSAGKPFAKQQVGNSLVITGGTNFNTGRYVIASVAAGVATVVGPGNITSGAGANGTGGLGGAVATDGIVGGICVANNQMFIKTGSFSRTSATNNVSGGCFAPAVNSIRYEGYGSVRGDLVSPPTITASGISTFTMVLMNNNGNWLVRNVILDASSLTSSRGLGVNRGVAYRVAALNCTNNGFAVVSNEGVLVNCRATGCSTQAAILATSCISCESYSNTIGGFAAKNGVGEYVHCLSYGNSGASSDGFTSANQGVVRWINCLAYNNGRHGFVGDGPSAVAINCIAENHTASGGIGFNFSNLAGTLIHCAGYGNNTADNNSGGCASTIGTITGTASFFTNAAGGDFSLNNAAGGGALLRAASFPATFPAGTTASKRDIGAAQHSPGGPFGIMGVM